MTESPDPFEPIFSATWSWIIERLGKSRVRELTGGLEPSDGAIRIGYPAAVEAQGQVNWHVWNEDDPREWSAHALVDRALGESLEAEYLQGPIPEPIARAALDAEDRP
ncbi:hypothetical protein [Arthrobacter sp. JSM 101049]|uniref:hypothetical protein n=1 Tax=Arthrobacter sp. JSM 101049 TaxID=929097 RepID=UPI003566BC46